MLEPNRGQKKNSIEMKATDIKMYISTLSIIEKGKEIGCGDFLGGRTVKDSQEDALNGVKNAVYMYLFASIMQKEKGYKTMAFTIAACNSTIYDNSMKTEIVCKIGYKEMIQLIKDGYRSPLFNTRKWKSLVDTRLKELKIA